MPTERLCVATFGEDVSWVARSGMEACIYDATSSRPGLIPVPNEAREASQYLRHIIANYGDFRDYELFLQGHPFDHNEGIMTTLRAREWIGKRKFPLSRRRVRHRRLGSGHNRAGLAFARELGIELNENTRWIIGAQFAASREALESRSLSWWRKVFAKVVIEREVSPWAIERVWWEMI
jgi:hypothetical protein